MRIIDNVSDLLGDDLKREITPGSKVRIAASTFSIFAFEALRQEPTNGRKAAAISDSRSSLAAASTSPPPPNPRSELSNCPS